MWCVLTGCPIFGSRTIRLKKAWLGRLTRLGLISNAVDAEGRQELASNAITIIAQRVIMFDVLLELVILKRGRPCRKILVNLMSVPTAPSSALPIA
jgi:hypothetical protein